MSAKKLTPAEVQSIQEQLAPGERLIEITTTIRWVSTKDLEGAAEELKALTDSFHPDKRVTGYVNASVLDATLMGR